MMRQVLQNNMYSLWAEESQNRWFLFLSNGQEEKQSLFHDFKLVSDCDGKRQISAMEGYDSIKQDENVYEGYCEITSDTGSVISLLDRYALDADKVVIKREFYIKRSSTQKEVFYIETTIPLSQDVPPENQTWFAPGCWYGKGQPYFRLNENGEAGGPVDFYSAPLILCYNDASGDSISFADFSAGTRKTVVEDNFLNLPGNIISNHFYLPGMNIRKTKDNGTDFVYTYPGYTYWNKRGYLYRMLPLSEGIKREAVLEIRLNRYKDYRSALKESWRTIWGETKQLRKFRDPIEVRNALLDYVDKSFTSENGIAIYMKDVEFNEASSGFLFRNIDLAHLMLEATSEQPDPGRKEHAIAVIESQIEKGRMYGVGKLEDLRPSVEAIASLLKCYEWAQKNDYPAERWLHTVISESQEFIPLKEYFSIPLLCALYRHTKVEQYIASAKHKGEYFWNEYFNKFFFTGGITDCEPNTIDRESAILALEGYLDLYEIEKDNLWLDRAVFCGDYLETMQVIQDIDMDPYGATGKERDRRFNHTITMAGAGNNMTAIGLSHIGAGGACGDIYNIYAAPDYWRLFHYTKNSQYLDFARELLYHSLQFVDMGDRKNGASDLIHNTGKGFINEFYAIGIDSYYVTGRGLAHGENIGWCPYVVLSSLYRLKQMTGSYTL